MDEDYEKFGFADRSSRTSKAHEDGNDNNNTSRPDNNHLHPHDSIESGPFTSSKERTASQSSLEFGRGERSPSAGNRNMLKHATTTTTTTPTGSSKPQAPGQTHNSPGEADSTTTSDSHMKLPQRFVVKYLGFRETSNLWGIKYTRRPVDEMVSDAKTLLTTNPDKSLALLRMEVTEEGILVGPMPQNTNAIYPNGKFAIESISYGVQDLVYTRVFAMIVVKADGQSEFKLSQLAKASSTTEGSSLPFRCHAFVCDSRQTARKLTYSLASSFEIFSKKVTSGKIAAKPKKFAIDLRPPEEMEADLADSEA